MYKDHDGAFGSGIYCCRSCANKRIHSAETKLKQSSAGKLHIDKAKHEIRSCPICNIEFDTLINRNKIYCSDTCRKLFFQTDEYKNNQSKILTGNTGGYRIHSARSRFHGGYYRDVWMDSSWEIAFAKKLDELNILWDRNKSYKFPYIAKDGKHRNYHPDFYLIDYDCFIEIKGYWTEEIRHKVDSSMENNNFKLYVLESLKAIENFESINDLKAYAKFVQ